MGSPLSTLRKTIVLMVGLAFVLSVPLVFSTPAAAGIVPITLYGSRTGGAGVTNTSAHIPCSALSVRSVNNPSLNLVFAARIMHRAVIAFHHHAAVRREA